MHRPKGDRGGLDPLPQDRFNWEEKEPNMYVWVDITYARLFKDEDLTDLKALYKKPWKSWFEKEKKRIQKKYTMSEWEFSVWLEKTLPLLWGENIQNESKIPSVRKKSSEKWAQLQASSTKTLIQWYLGKDIPTAYTTYELDPKPTQVFQTQHTTAVSSNTSEILKNSTAITILCIADYFSNYWKFDISLKQALSNAKKSWCISEHMKLRLVLSWASEEEVMNFLSKNWITIGRKLKIKKLDRSSGNNNPGLQSIDKTRQTRGLVQWFLSKDDTSPYVVFGATPDGHIKQILNHSQDISQVPTLKNPAPVKPSKTSDKDDIEKLFRLAHYFSCYLKFDNSLLRALLKAKKVRLLSEKMKKKLIWYWATEDEIEKFLTKFSIIIGRKTRVNKSATVVKIWTETPVLQNSALAKSSAIPEKKNLQPKKKLEILPEEQKTLFPPEIKNLQSVIAPIKTPPGPPKPTPIIRMTARWPQTFYPMPKVETSQSASVNYYNWFEKKYLTPQVIHILERALGFGYMPHEDIVRLETNFRVPKESIQSFLIGQAIYRWKPTLEQIRRRTWSMIKKHIAWGDEWDEI